MFSSAFCIPELMLAILKYLDRRSLVRIARTNRSFEKMAMEFIWTDLNSLNPLLALIPPVKWIDDNQCVSKADTGPLLQC